MGRMKKTRKFAEVKRLINPKEAKGVEKQNGKEKGGKGKKKKDDDDKEEVRQMYATPRDSLPERCSQLTMCYRTGREDCLSTKIRENGS